MAERDEQPRCPNCGYRLTGLPEAGQCPECGQAYDHTSNDDPGDRARQWVRQRFDWPDRIVAVGIVLFILLVIVLFLFF